jgi:hypothetical protein
MSAKKKKSVTPSPPPVTAPAVAAAATTETSESFAQRHPKIANLILAGLWVYVAMLGLLALDQTFHWGIFSPKIPLTP